MRLGKVHLKGLLREEKRLLVDGGREIIKTKWRGGTPTAVIGKTVPQQETLYLA